jgi:hypothetical protein
MSLYRIEASHPQFNTLGLGVNTDFGSKLQNI